MPYTVQEWKDEIADPNRIDPATGKPIVIQKGSSFSANRMNHIEDGIKNATDVAETLDAQSDDLRKKIDELTADALDMRMQNEFEGNARKLGVVANMYWITFRDINDIDLIAGKYDITQKKLYLP